MADNMKLVTKEYVDNAIQENKITIDTEISDTSENPVQNKVIKTALDNKQDNLHLSSSTSMPGFYSIKPEDTSNIINLSGLNLLEGDTIRAKTTVNTNDISSSTTINIAANNEVTVQAGISTDYELTLAPPQSIDKFGIRAYEGNDPFIATEPSHVTTKKYVDNVLTTGLSGKLDKVETTAARPRTYIINTDGTQGTLSYTDGSAFPYTLAQRTSAGNIFVADPTLDDHAATKKYVDVKTDNRTQFQKLIDETDLTQRSYVDLSTLASDRYYYNDFSQCISDINNGVTTNSVSKSSTNVCVLTPFFYDRITAYLVQLLKNVEITSTYQINKSTILDVNGFELAFKNTGSIGGGSKNATFYEDVEFMIYGAGLNSLISSTPYNASGAAVTTFDIMWGKTYFIGGKYTIDITQVNSGGWTTDPIIIDRNVSTVPRDIYMYNVDLKETMNVDYASKKADEAHITILVNAPNATNKSCSLNIDNCTFNTYYESTSTYDTYIITQTTSSYIINADNSYFKADRNKTNITKIDDKDTICVNGRFVNLSNCYCWAQRIAVEIDQLGYINNCRIYSAHGLYTAYVYGTTTLAQVYVQNSVLGHVDNPDGAACCYIGYGSTVYMDNCSFDIPTEDTTTKSFAVKGGLVGYSARLYISNCNPTRPRVDVSQNVYYGAGIPQEIIDIAVAGRKYTTNNNYSTYNNIYFSHIKKLNSGVIPADVNFIENSRNAQSAIAVKEYVDNVVGDINTLLATLVTVSDNPQSEESTNEEEIIAPVTEEVTE